MGDDELLDRVTEFLFQRVADRWRETGRARIAELLRNVEFRTRDELIIKNKVSISQKDFQKLLRQAEMPGFLPSVKHKRLEDKISVTCRNCGIRL